MPDTVNILIRATNLKPSEYHVHGSMEHGKPFLTLTCLKEFGSGLLMEATAKIVAKDRISLNETCAITLEPLNSYKTLYVGICSHVFSDGILNYKESCTECPLCRTVTGWTPVKID